MPRQSEHDDRALARTQRWIRLRLTSWRVLLEDERTDWSNSLRICGRELRYGRPFGFTALALVVVLLVVQLGSTPGVSKQLDEVSYGRISQPVSQKRSAAEVFATKAASLRTVLESSNGSHFTHNRVRATGAAYEELIPMMRVVRGELDANETKLEGLGASEALERLATVRRKFDTSAKSLELAIRELQRSSGKAAHTAVARAQDALARLAPVPDARPLADDQLGFGARSAIAHFPVLNASLAPAYGVPTPGGGRSSLSRDPEPADVTTSNATAATAAIADLAARLDRDPVKIFSYVRNEIQFDPYLGIRKGAAQTLKERAGSDADQAALLISLLRTSGVPARFVSGVVEMPVAQAANWLGMDTARGASPEAAARVLAASGVPTTVVRVNGDLTRVRFAHFWVEAYVPASAYRGVDEGLGGRRWVPLDASVKRNEFVAPSQGLQPLSASEGAAIGDRFKQAVVAQPNGTHVVRDLDSLVTYTRDVLKPSTTNFSTDEMTSGQALESLLGATNIVAETASYLPASLPYRTVAVTDEVREVNANFTARVEVTIAGADPLTVPLADQEGQDAVTYSAPSSDLADRRVTVAYAPATARDAEIIDAYHGLLDTPSYAAALVPVIRVDGRVVAAGQRPVPAGYTQNLKIEFHEPGFAPQVVENGLTVGGITALTVNVGRKTQAALDEKIKSMSDVTPAITPDTALTDRGVGQLLALAGDMYFLQADSGNRGFQSPEVFARRSLSGALSATGLKTSFIAGYPVMSRLSGVQMDVDADNQVVVPTASEPTIVDRYLSSSGANASDAEASSLEMIFGGTNGVSTTRVFAMAAKQGIPLVHLTAENLDQAIEELSLPAPDVRAVRAAVSEGDGVVVPARTVTIGTWTGAGWVITGDSQRGFSISGGLSGGASDADPRQATSSWGACVGEFIAAFKAAQALRVFLIASGAVILEAVLALIGWAFLFFWITIPVLLLIGYVIWQWDWLRNFLADAIGVVADESNLKSIWDFLRDCTMKVVNP